MDTIRIVLAEDHALVREGTRRILEQYPNLKVVGEAGDGQQALDLIKHLQPDILISDIRMPVLTGVEVVRRMKEYSPSTKALMLTAYDEDDYILALMEAGASGYLLKTARAGELVEAVNSVYAGEMVIQPAIAAKVARLWVRDRSANERVTPEQLSGRERETLQFAASGMRNKAIADKLNISVRTVEGHFTSIFAKLGVSSRIEAVLYAMSHHLVASGEEGPTRPGLGRTP